MLFLKFDGGSLNDAGRTFYRGLFIFGALKLFTHMQLTSNKQRLIQMIQRDFWSPSNCLLQLTAKQRLFLLSMTASFVPFIAKRVYNYSFGVTENNALIFYGPSAFIGAASGITTTVLCVAAPRKKYLSIHVASLLLGAVYGLLYTHMMRRVIYRKYAAVEQCGAVGGGSGIVGFGEGAEREFRL